MSKAFANTVVRMAFDTTVMSSNRSVVFKKNVPSAGSARGHLKTR